MDRLRGEFFVEIILEFYRYFIALYLDKLVILVKKKSVVMGELKTAPMANRFPKNLKVDFVKGEWIGK